MAQYHDSIFVCTNNTAGLDLNALNEQGHIAAPSCFVFTPCRPCTQSNNPEGNVFQISRITNISMNDQTRPTIAAGKQCKVLTDACALLTRGINQEHPISA